MTAPMTPFELGGRVDWTPLEAEQDYVDSLIDYAAGKLVYRVVGTSVDGNPMRLFRVGHGPRTMLWTAQMHGNEPASREVMYTFLQWAVDSDDPDWADYLEEATLYIMPTCAPDTITSRVNKNGINVNRDFLSLQAPETRAIASVVSTYRPEVVVDWHEFHADYAEYSPSPAQNLNADPGLVSLSGDLFDAAKSEIESHEWTVQPYNIEKGPNWLINNALVQGSVSALMETSTFLDPAQRHDMHLVSTETIWRWHADHLSDVEDAVMAARSVSSTRDDPISLQMQFDSTPPTVDPVPGGYYVPINSWGNLQSQRDVYAFASQQAAAGYYLPTAQEHRIILAYLVDPDSPAAVVHSQRMDDPPLSPPPAQIGKNFSLHMRIGGFTRPVTIHYKAPGTGGSD